MPKQMSLILFKMYKKSRTKTFFFKIIIRKQINEVSHYLIILINLKYNEKDVSFQKLLQLQDKFF